LLIKWGQFGDSGINLFLLTKLIFFGNLIYILQKRVLKCQLLISPKREKGNEPMVFEKENARKAAKERLSEGGKRKDGN